MKRLLTLLLTLIPAFVMAQSHLYSGRSTYSSDILYTFDGKHLYKGNSTYSSNILYTVSGRIPIAVLILLL